LTARSKKPGISIMCAASFALMAAAVDAQQTVEGTWVNGDGDGWIQLSITGGELRGVIIGSPDDPDNLRPSRLDAKNPERSLRARPVRGLTILSGFRRGNDGRWTGGRVYDPNSGNTYRGTITVVDETTLKLRGFIGISLFGRTEYWRRRQPR
jgi:uncharacterized protein (DUF2147 family)